MYRYCLLLCTLFFITVAARSQASAEDSVKHAISQLFDAMRASDSVALEACFAHGAMLQSVATENGETTVTNENIHAFASSIGKAGKGNASEQITFDVVKVDGELAMVWTPYKFFWKGSFSHCGVDAYVLVRKAAGWKIQYIIDTRRKGDCL